MDALSPAKGLIFRIVHRDNVPWIMKNGLHCRSSSASDPKFVDIGNTELIEKRRDRIVPCSPGGSLSDYVPFYFTPFSPMMLNIKTGWGGITKRSNEEIVIFVSSLFQLQKCGIPFVFTDRHAYLQLAQFYSDIERLDQIDWDLLKRRDFKTDPEDPSKLERYQAEALVHKVLPCTALLGIVCCNDSGASTVAALAAREGLHLKILARSGWYF